MCFYFLCPQEKSAIFTGTLFQTKTTTTNTLTQREVVVRNKKQSQITQFYVLLPLHKTIYFYNILYIYKFDHRCNGHSSVSEMYNQMSQIIYQTDQCQPKVIINILHIIHFTRLFHCVLR